MGWMKTHHPPMGTHVTNGSLGNDTTGARDRQSWGWMISPMPLSAPSPTGLGHSLAHTMPWQGAGHVSRFGDSGTRWARGTDGCHVVKGSGWGGCGDTPRSPIQTHPLAHNVQGGFFGGGWRPLWLGICTSHQDPKLPAQVGWLLLHFISQS